MFTVLQAGAGARTVQTCGLYQFVTDQLTDTDGYHTERLEVRDRSRVVATWNDAYTDVRWCRDVTADGVPEAMVSIASGGAHCCTTFKVYSLTRPLRQVLSVDAGNVDDIIPRQLDGTGPLELLSWDDRFAYAYGMSYAESPFLPVVYAYQGGRYVLATRRYPGILRDAGTLKAPPGTTTDLLLAVSSRLLLGQDPEAVLRQAPARLAEWMRSYLPDLRQDLGGFGADDWPARAGVARDQQLGGGRGGAFTAAGRREYVAVVRDGQMARLRLFSVQGERVVMSPPLASAPFSWTPETGPVWQPAFTVARSDGHEDLVMQDLRGVGLRFSAYRLKPDSATRLQDDPLTAALGCLGDFASLARTTRTQANTFLPEKQRAEARSALPSLLAQTERWTPLFAKPIAVRQLQDFHVHTLTVTRQSSAEVILRATLDLNFDEGSPKREAFTLTVRRQEGRWQVKALTQQPLIASLTF